MFVEITDEQRTAGAFRLYTAHREWERNRRDGTMTEVLRPVRPGHRLPNGNWLVPAGCLSLDRTERERAVAGYVIDQLDLDGIGES